MINKLHNLFTRRRQGVQAATAMSVAPEPLVSPCAQRLLRYWQSKRDGSALPSRSDVDPAELSAILPHLFMFDVKADPLHFVFRLVGTKVVDLFGRDLTGSHVDQHQMRDVAFWHYDLMKRVVEQRTPLALHAKAAWHDGATQWLGVELLYVPLSSDGIAVDVLVGTAAAHGADHVSFDRVGDPKLFDITVIRQPQFTASEG